LVFHVADLPRYGFWSFLHETRTDWATLTGTLYLFAVGAGRWSANAAFTDRRPLERRGA